MPSGHRHLVRCTCILHQFSKMKDPPFHHFPVFSVVNDDDEVQIKHVQCTNCGIVHRVFDLCRSEILHGREAFGAIQSVGDVKVSLTPNVREVLDASNVDVTVYEHARFIIDNKKWGEHVVLSSESEGGWRTVKYLQILGEALIRVESATNKEEL